MKVKARWNEKGAQSNTSPLLCKACSKESVHVLLVSPLRAVCVIESIHLVAGVSRSVSLEQWGSLILLSSSRFGWWVVLVFVLFYDKAISPFFLTHKLCVWRSRPLAEHFVTVHSEKGSDFLQIISTLSLFFCLLRDLDEFLVNTTTNTAHNLIQMIPIK